MGIHRENKYDGILRHHTQASRASLGAPDPGIDGRYVKYLQAKFVKALLARVGLKVIVRGATRMGVLLQGRTRLVTVITAAVRQEMSAKMSMGDKLFFCAVWQLNTYLLQPWRAPRRRWPQRAQGCPGISMT